MGALRTSTGYETNTTHALETRQTPDQKIHLIPQPRSNSCTFLCVVNKIGDFFLTIIRFIVRIFTCGLVTMPIKNDVKKISNVDLINEGLLPRRMTQTTKSILTLQNGEPNNTQNSQLALTPTVQDVETHFQSESQDKLLLFMNSLGLTPEAIIGEDEIRRAKEALQHSQSVLINYELSESQLNQLYNAPSIAYKLLSILINKHEFFPYLCFDQQTGTIFFDRTHQSPHRIGQQLQLIPTKEDCDSMIIDLLGEHGVLLDRRKLRELYYERNRLIEEFSQEL